MHENQLDHLLEEMEKTVIGRKEEFPLVLTALLTEGHVLFVDLPGTG